MTKRIESFVKEVAEKASQSPYAFATYEECVAEYRSQIEEGDYFNLCSYAETEGIKIPRALGDWRKKEAGGE